MLIKIFTALSLLSGIGAAIGSSLWPLAFIGGFVGCYLGLIVLTFLVVWIMSELVDCSVPQERMDPVYRRVMYLVIDFVVTFMRIHIHTEGLEKTPKEDLKLIRMTDRAKRLIAEQGNILDVVKRGLNRYAVACNKGIALIELK